MSEGYLIEYDGKLYDDIYALSSYTSMPPGAINEYLKKGYKKMNKKEIKLVSGKLPKLAHGGKKPAPMWQGDVGEFKKGDICLYEGCPCVVASITSGGHHPIKIVFDDGSVNYVDKYEIKKGVIV